MNAASKELRKAVDEILMKVSRTQIGTGEWQLSDSLHGLRDEVLSLVHSEVRAVLDGIGEPTLQDVGLMQPDQYEGGKIINDWWKSCIEAERKKYE